MIKKTIVAHTR